MLPLLNLRHGPEIGSVIVLPRQYHPDSTWSVMQLRDAEDEAEKGVQGREWQWDDYGRVNAYYPMRDAPSVISQKKAAWQKELNWIRGWIRAQQPSR